jgi:hypothetical protein
MSRYQLKRQVDGDDDDKEQDQGKERPFEKLGEHLSIAVSEVHRKVKVLAKVALCHRRQVDWVDEDQSEEQVLIVLSDLLQLRRLYLTHGLVLLVYLLVGAIKLVQLLCVMSISLHLVPPLHLSLRLVNKESPEQDPQHESNECSFNHELNIG